MEPCGIFVGVVSGDLWTSSQMVNKYFNSRSRVSLKKYKKFSSFDSEYKLIVKQPCLFNDGSGLIKKM